MSPSARIHDFDGVFVDPLPPPRVIRASAQPIPRPGRSYTDQLEDDLLRSEATVLGLEIQVRDLREQLEAAREQLESVRTQPAATSSKSSKALFLATGELKRAQKHIQRQRNKIERLEAALREQWQAPRFIRIGRLNINVVLRRVELDGRSFNPTGGELSLLAYLAQHPDHIFDTASLGAGIGCNSSSTRTFMYRLRPKMEAIGAADYLRSKGRGGDLGGYWMTDPEQGGPS